MLNALVAAVLVLAPQDEPPQPVDPRRLEAALAELEQAFDEGTEQDRVAAMQRHGALPDPEIVRWVEHGLRDREPVVRDAAIDTLRFQELGEEVSKLVESDPEGAAALIRRWVEES